METYWYMESEALIKPCDYYEVKSLDGVHRYFWVTLYLLVDDDLSTHAFIHSNEQFENMMLAREAGVNTWNTSFHVLVSHDYMPGLYRQILDYENVLKSDSGKKQQSKYTFAKH